MVLACLVISGLLTLAGTTCAVFAFTATWQAYGGGQAMYPGLAIMWRRIKRLAFWRKPQVVYAGGIASATAAASADLRRLPPPFPENALMRTQVAWLRREQEVMAEQVMSLQSALLKSEGALREELSRSDQRHREAIEETRAMAKDIATGDVPLQLAALLLISSGALVGLVPSFMAL